MFSEWAELLNETSATESVCTSESMTACAAFLARCIRPSDFMEPEVSMIITTFFVPAAPLDDDMAYLVEAVDGYLDDNLKPLSYPPVHPHHSAVYVTGFPEKLAYNNPSSPFFGFNPIARLPL